MCPEVMVVPPEMRHQLRLTHEALLADFTVVRSVFCKKKNQIIRTIHTRKIFVFPMMGCPLNAQSLDVGVAIRNQ